MTTADIAAGPLPKVIVIAEPEVYDTLANSGVAWDLLPRADSVDAFWAGLDDGTLDNTASVLLFSDSLGSAPDDLETALAHMAPAASVFLVAHDSTAVSGILSRARQIALGTDGVDADAGINVVSPQTRNLLLEGMRRVLDQEIAFPLTFSNASNEPVMAHAAVPVASSPEVALPTAVQQPAVQQTQGYPQSGTPTVAPVYGQPIAPTVPVMPAFQPPSMPQVGMPSFTVSSQYAPELRHEAVGGPMPDTDILEGQVTVAVTSSKGGSGKSTTAMLFAGQVAQSSRAAAEAGMLDAKGQRVRPLKVVLIDMDTRDGQVASLIGQYVPTSLNIRVAPVWDAETVLKHLVHDERLGIDALLAPVRPRTADDVGPDFYQHVIQVLKRTHDVIVLDTSVNYLDPLIAQVCLPEATAILFVTTLAATSVQGMARALREVIEPAEHGGMGIRREKIGVVVNMSVMDVGMEKSQVDKAALKVPIVGVIPMATRDVLTATNYGSMYLLLKHPILGPAYFRLANTCMPGRGLIPIVAEGTTEAPRARQPQQPQQPQQTQQPQQYQQAPQGGPAQGPPKIARKGVGFLGKFGKKG